MDCYKQMMVRIAGYKSGQQRLFCTGSFRNVARFEEPHSFYDCVKDAEMSVKKKRRIK